MPSVAPVVAPPSPPVRSARRFPPLPPRTRRFLARAAILTVALGMNLLYALGPVMLVSALVFLVVGVRGAARRLLAGTTHGKADRLMAAVTLTGVFLLYTGEALSAGKLLGSRNAWLVACYALGTVGLWLAAAVDLPESERSDRFLAAQFRRLNLPGKALLVVFLVPVTMAFIKAWFTGINVWDNIYFYLAMVPMCIRHNSLLIHDWSFQYFPYLNRLFVLLPMVFVPTDLFVNPMSFGWLVLCSVAVHGIARRLGFSFAWALVAAFVPWTMPSVLMHASGSNFDIFAGMWMLFALYFALRGYGPGSRRWLGLAALSLGLALATKPTFWFLLPAILVVAGLILWRCWRRRGAGAALRTGALCLALFLVSGAVVPVRNRVLLGYFISPSDRNNQVTSGSLTPGDKLRFFIFNTAARGFQILTPPLLVPADWQPQLEPFWLRCMETVGYEIPDKRFMLYDTREGQLRHVAGRYESGHAYPGATFLLVLIPAGLLALLAGRWIFGPRRVYAWCVGLAAAGYFLTMNATWIYTPDDGRYLVEMCLLACPLAPALLAWIRPDWLRMALLAGLGAVALTDMRLALLNDRASPPERIFTTPRAEQYYRFFGGDTSVLETVATLDRKYPPAEMPVVYSLELGNDFPAYAYIGPAGNRQVHYWNWKQGKDGPLPGPMVTKWVEHVKTLRYWGHKVFVDRLSDRDMLVLPLDQLRVRMELRRDPDNRTGDAIELNAFVDPAMYHQPVYEFSFATSAGSEIFQGPEAENTAVIPLDVLKGRALRVSVREAGTDAVKEKCFLDPKRLLNAPR